VGFAAAALLLTMPASEAQAMVKCKTNDECTNIRVFNQAKPSVVSAA
jgi:hypothetical protein